MEQRQALQPVVEFWLRAELRRVLRGVYKRHDEEIALPHPRNVTRASLGAVTGDRGAWLVAPKIDGRRALIVRARIFGDEFVVELDRRLVATVLSGPGANGPNGPMVPNGPNGPGANGPGPNGPNGPGPNGPGSNGPMAPLASGPSTDEVRVVVDAELCGGVYHVHDVFVLGGVQTHTLKFATRLDLVEEAISELGVASVVAKTFVPLGSEIARTAVATDGFILSHSAAPATFGSDPWVLKWKPAEKCTVDLLVERKKCGAHFSRRATARTSNGRRALAEFDAAIFQGTLPCIFEFAMRGGKWEPVLRREDKSTANTDFVVEQTLVAVNEAISFDEIVGN
jgi:hypothetical protein